MVDGTGLSRGDRNRNGRLGRLRVLLPARRERRWAPGWDPDLAQVKQAAVVTDHDSQVVARRRVPGLGAGIATSRIRRTR